MTSTTAGGAAPTRGAMTCAVLTCAMLILAPGASTAQEAAPAPLPFPEGSAWAEPDDPVRLDELVALARGRNPAIRAARHRAAAAEAQVPQAGALPDPTLSAGLMYLPLPDLDLSAEGMTMFSFQVSQRIPVPGSRALREAEAEALHRAALREVEELELQVVARLKAAYHELVFAQETERILERNRALLEDLASVAEGRLAVGGVPQQDVLRAQTEVTRIDEQLAGLDARRTAALAEINAILDRDPLQPVTPAYPRELRRVATAIPPAGAFTAASLEGGLGSGLPSLGELQAELLRSRPSLLAHIERIEAMEQRRARAERERWPDLGWMVAYSPRSGRRDMLGLGLSVDLPLFRGRKQDQAVAEAVERVADHEVQHHEMVAELRSEVAARYNTLVRTRERILLVAEGVIPQARATVESATGAYQAGRVEFSGLLEAQATLFRNEIELVRLLADFGSELAALEAVVGIEIAPASTDHGETNR
jgi:outer membrane protein, heavy metal efflux system